MAEEGRVEREVYLESLSQSDRENLGLIMTAFLDYLDTENLTGELLVVGGSVVPETRGTKRKDIDLVPLIDNQSSFEDFEKLVTFFRDKTEFMKIKVIRPIIDEEFGDPEILRHDGSFILLPDEGTPFEFIRIDPTVDKGDRFFSVLLPKATGSK
ncbi:TPA: hypothetical protein DEQ95_00125 [Candidatus Beckwithbacteria bacterium]|nr:MAG: hypothetical protein UY43_C0001G0315 [Candidatus Beckwithbacteria bacterium GW2011_GWC1_49_16]OGD48093.1 MAG: hypothetical protein A2877_00085 [Candidatus Beckwithbacteria bacterium RIFCSPHIGHO2_01_FULL_49_39]OGD49880.1 MAG: hypothetical protein A3D86_04400 [Candidatus Beckwithbacteria bacterium RIFCSPHIGHO2_02_FULL_49_13]OGD59108.1 MAG: hypothetical protein A3J22_04485 [Candidatus Beckwithbacteria bacterium RIFCSPLOWO2_02_FULL_49_12]OGD60625.1 MAG: hypothetical protein A3B59_01880 [Can